MCPCRVVNKAGPKAFSFRPLHAMTLRYEAFVCILLSSDFCPLSEWTFGVSVAMPHPWGNQSAHWTLARAAARDQVSWRRHAGIYSTIEMVVNSSRCLHKERPELRGVSGPAFYLGYWQISVVLLKCRESLRWPLGAAIKAAMGEPYSGPEAYIFTSDAIERGTWRVSLELLRIAFF